MSLTIIPKNEPNGEGNGWEECAERDATSFAIDNGEEVIDTCATRAEAELYVQTHKERVK